MYCLRYVRDGKTRVVIMDGWSLAHARMRAAWLEPGVFIVGYRIDRATAIGVLPQAMGRVLTRQEAAALLSQRSHRPRALRVDLAEGRARNL